MNYCITFFYRLLDIIDAYEKQISSMKKELDFYK
jgi:hypothetical protein